MQKKVRFLIELTEGRTELLRYYCNVKKASRSSFFSALFENWIKKHQKDIEGIGDTVNNLIKENFYSSKEKTHE